MKFFLSLILFIGWASLFGEEPIHNLLPHPVRTYHFPEIVETVPGEISIITGTDLADNLSPFLTGELSRVSGLEIKKYSGNPLEGGVSMRGYTGGQHVLVLVDGMRMNRPDLGGINWGLLPIWQVESVEVYKGSQAVVYGGKAIAGVVNIHTRTPTEASGFIRSNAGTFDSYDFQAGAAVPAAGGVVEAGAQWSRSDGYRENSGYRVRNGAVRGFWKTERHALRVYGQLTETELEYPGGLVSEEFPENPRESMFPDQKSEESQRLLNVDYQLSLGDAGDVSVLGGVSDREIDWNLSGVYGRNVFDQVFADTVYQMENGPWKWQAGLNLREAQLDSYQFSQPQREFIFGRADLQRSHAAGFVNGRLDMGSLILRAGARGEWTRLEAQYRNRSSFASPETPFDPVFNERRRDEGSALQAGFTWHLQENARIWGRVDRFYRFPALDEIAAYQGYDLNRPFNDDLSAEEGQGMELGASVALGSWLLRTSGFLHQLDDEIHFDPVNNLNTNLDETRRYGLELRASREGIYTTWDLAYNRTYAEFRSGEYRGNRIPLVPRNQWTASVGVHDPDQRYQVFLGGSYYSSQIEGNDFLNTERSLPDYVVLHLNGVARVNDHWTVRAAVENLLDESYASMKFGGLWYPEAGRHYKAGIEYAF